MKTKVVLCLLILSASFLAAEVKVSYGYSTHQNGRPYQEDRFTYAYVDFHKGYNPFVAGRNYYRGNFFGIYDGHGGSAVSSYLQNNFHKQLRSSPILAFAFCRAFDVVEKYALENCDDGSTAVTAFINKEGKLCVAWVGDSRAVLEKNGTVQFATQDHKPERVDEKERIKNASGGVYFDGVWRVNGLAVSRSIGDRRLKNMGQGQIVADPSWEDIYLREGNHFLIMASDGLWDVITNEEAVAMVTKALGNRRSLNDIAQELQNAAIKKGSKDNITVCVVKFD